MASEAVGSVGIAWEEQLRVKLADLQPVRVLALGTRQDQQRFHGHPSGPAKLCGLRFIAREEHGMKLGPDGFFVHTFEAVGPV